MKYSFAQYCICFILGAMLVAGQVHAQGTIWGMTEYGGASNAGTFFKMNFDGTGVTKVKEFDIAYQGGIPSWLRLEPGPGGLSDKFYGVTQYGGFADEGIIFQYDPSTNAYTKLYDFGVDTVGLYPIGSLTLVGDKLYGVTSSGGTNHTGIVFEFDPATKTLVKKSDIPAFTNTSTVPDYEQRMAGLLTLANGKLYGTLKRAGASNNGLLFEVDPVSGTFTIKHEFSGGADGANPYSFLMASGSLLYGTTQAGGANDFGVLFEFDLNAAPGSNFTKRVDFNNGFTGVNPQGGLVQVAGKIYGTTHSGGAGGGTLFEYVPGTSTVTKKIDFPSEQILPLGPLLYTNGLIYGATESGLYMYDPTQPSGSGLTNIIDMNTQQYDVGILPIGGFALASSGKLYAAMIVGGQTQRGSIVEYDPSQSLSATNPIAKIHFNSSPAGFAPFGGFTSLNGKLYGVTTLGGNNGGAFFEFDPSNASYIETTFRTAGLISGFPVGPPALANNGKFYGFTLSPNNQLFEYDPDTHTLTNKTTLDNSLGSGINNLMTASDGSIFGTTNAGAANGRGCIFQYDPIGNTATKKLDFPNDYVTDAFTSLTLAPNGKFYYLLNGGTTAGGSIVEYEPGANTATKRYDFTGGVNGSNPVGTMVFCTANEKMYGITKLGGAFNYGTIFEYTLPTEESPDGTVVHKFDFAPATGGDPQGGMVESGNGKLYGTTTIGASAGQGAIFEYDPIQNSYSAKFDFSNTAGTYASGLLYAVKENQHITFDPLSSKSFGQAFDLTATSSSGLALTYTSSNTAVATVNGSIVTVVGVGTTTITAKQKGNGGYFPAADVQQPLTTTKADQAITFDALPAKTFGDSFSLGATASSNLAVTYTSSNTAVATISGNTVTIVATGTVTIKASQPGNENYNAAADIERQLVINKSDQVITFNALSDKQLSDGPFTLNATTSSNLAIAYSSSDASVATVSGNTVTIHSRGSTVIQATQGGDTNYNAASKSQTLNVVNVAPVVANAIPQQEAQQLSTFSFAFSENVFSDADHDVLTFTATLADGSKLPAWLTFNASTRTLSGTPGRTDNSVTVRVKANDGFEGIVTTDFSLKVNIITEAEQDVSHAVRFFPNPVHTTLVVENDIPGNGAALCIRSAIGQTVHEMKMMQPRAEVDATPWSPGWYVVEVKTEEGIQRIKILKQ